METTPRWELPHLFAGQAQKEIFHNEALARIDMLLHGQVESAGETVPPAFPSAGQCWIVADGGSGDWDGRDGQVACWTEGGWRFVVPRAGLSLWVADSNHGRRYDGVNWRDEAVRADGLYVEGLRVAGPRLGAVPDPSGGMVVDAEGRVALGAILAVLREHGLINA